jgi:hypothetical protein
MKVFALYSLYNKKLSPLELDVASAAGAISKYTL